MGIHWHKTALIIVLSILLVGIAVSGCAPSSPLPAPGPSTTTMALTPAPSSNTTQTTKTHTYTDGRTEIRGNGEPIELINNPNAINPTFAELGAFLKRDRTDEYSYIVGPPKNAFVSSDFAETVHNNAEAAGIRAAWVGIDIEGKTEGHALNAFETTDLGLVYIDCTGKGLWDNKPRFFSGDRRALVKVGESYALGALDKPTSTFWFFISAGVMRNSISNYPSIWEHFAYKTALVREAWMKTHDVNAMGQKWMQEWLQEHKAELSKSGRVLEPANYGSRWDVSMLDCWDVPWFQPEQVLVHENRTREYWLGFMDEPLLTQYDRVEQKIIEVDGLPIAWEIGWRDGVRHWSNNWLKPYQVLGDIGVVSAGAVKDIHIHW